MNYIQEELLRQRNALAALMSGTTAEEAEERERSGPDRAERKTGKKAAADRGSDGVMGRAGETGAEAVAVSGEAMEEEVSVLKEAADRRDAELRASTPKRSGGWTALQRMEPWRTGSGASGTERTAMDLRAVSRGIQRDARRYDGGFSAY